MVGVNEDNPTSVYQKPFGEGQCNNEGRGDFEDFNKKAGSDGGAINDAFRPKGVEPGVVIRVEVRKEVRDGEVTGVFETVDDKAGFRNEFGLGK